MRMKLTLIGILQKGNGKKRNESERTKTAIFLFLSTYLLLLFFLYLFLFSSPFLSKRPRSTSKKPFLALRVPCCVFRCLSLSLRLSFVCPIFFISQSTSFSFCGVCRPRRHHHRRQQTQDVHSQEGNGIFMDTLPKAPSSLSLAHTHQIIKPFCLSATNLSPPPERLYMCLCLLFLSHPLSFD